MWDHVKHNGNNTTARQRPYAEYVKRSSLIQTTETRRKPKLSKHCKIQRAFLFIPGDKGGQEQIQ
jgi:hypothetical protein